MSMSDSSNQQHQAGHPMNRLVQSLVLLAVISGLSFLSGRLSMCRQAPTNRVAGCTANSIHTQKWFSVALHNQSASASLASGTQLLQQQMPQQSGSILPVRTSSIVNRKHCPQWLSHYQAMHNHKRGANGTKYLVHLSDASSGGLGDRLNGALCMLRLAVALDRVLLLRWAQPYDITEFIQPGGGIDWTITALSLEDGHVLSFIDNEGWASPQLQDGSLADVMDAYLTIRTNLPLNYSCKGCPVLHDIWTQEAACIWQVMFQPIPELVAAAEVQLTSWYPGSLVQPYVSVHLRLGGLTGEEGQPGPERGKSPFHNFLAAARCAMKLAHNHSIDISQSPLVVITDNHYLRQFLQEQHGVMRMVTPAGLPVHLDRAQGQSLAAHKSTIVDLLLLSWGECLVASRSGFSEHAWLLGGGKPCKLQLVECLK